ncbi:MAG: Gfo/Idh/MocA family oxidoreductase [Desulfobacterales bacterium]|nr:Gfo/Idh/MocA family oxidoreductase [Desulfobacterales bacterium]
MNKLRIGVMGCADIAWRAMLPAMMECEDVCPVAIASRTEEKARKFAERFKCDAFVGYEKLLGCDSIDAIYMPLPTGLHEEWVIKTLEAGKHILVEKSFAENIRSARAMVDLAREKKMLVLENFLFPHHLQHAWVNDLIARGELGDIHLLRCTFGFPPLPGNNFRYDRHLGGGALLDAGAYVVKASQLFLGSDLRVLGAKLKYDDDLGVDIYGDAMLTNKMEQVAQVSFGFNYYYQCNYEFLGTKGKLVVERAFTAAPGFRPTIRLEHQDLKQEFTLAADNHYVNMCRFFARTVINGEDFQVHWDSLISQAKLLDAIRKENV